MKRLKVILPAICFVIVVVILRTVIFIGYVPSESMEPVIPVGSKIIGTRIFFKLNNRDIIVFKHNNTYMVKRIAACPGETIKNSITGELLTVPKDSYYVLGDNSTNSYDSRYWNNPYVKRSDILAKYFQN